MDQTNPIDIPVWGPRFLNRLRSGDSVRTSALAAGVASSTPYHWYKRSAAFRELWDAAAAPKGARRRGWGGTRRKSTLRTDLFIAALGETSNVTAAAEAAGISAARKAIAARIRGPEQENRDGHG